MPKKGLRGKHGGKKGDLIVTIRKREGKNKQIIDGRDINLDGEDIRITEYILAKRLSEEEGRENGEWKRENKELEKDEWDDDGWLWLFVLVWIPFLWLGDIGRRGFWAFTLLIQFIELSPLLYLKSGYQVVWVDNYFLWLQKMAETYHDLGWLVLSLPWPTVGIIAFWFNEFATDALMVHLVVLNAFQIWKLSSYQGDHCSYGYDSFFWLWILFCPPIGILLVFLILFDLDIEEQLVEIVEFFLRLVFLLCLLRLIIYLFDN